MDRATDREPIDHIYEVRGAKAPESKFGYSPATNHDHGFAVVIKDDRFALTTMTTVENSDRAPLGDWIDALEARLHPLQVALGAPLGQQGVELVDPFHVQGAVLGPARVTPSLL